MVMLGTAPKDLHKINFAGCVLYVPLWKNKQVVNRIGGGSCTVTGTTYDKQGRTFNGTSDKITVTAAVNTIRSACLWIKPTDITSRSIVDFDSGTHSIEMDGSGDVTATGWDSPAIAVSGTGLVVNEWNFIAVATPTAFDGTAVVLGKEASFYAGVMGKALVYSRTLDVHEILYIYGATKWRYV